MAQVAKHLSVAELEERYRSSEAVTTARHYQTICFWRRVIRSRKCRRR
jgi:hypothetical protein